MGFTMGRSTEGMDVVTSFHRKPYGFYSSKSEKLFPWIFPETKSGSGAMAIVPRRNMLGQYWEIYGTAWPMAASYKP